MRFNRFASFAFFPIVLLAADCLSTPSGTGLPPPQTSSTTFVPRADYGARLEAPGLVIHGAGQSDAAFLNYVQALGAGRHPVVYKAYVALKYPQADFWSALKSQCQYYASACGTYLIPEIGLSMTTDGTPSAHYEGDVAAGLYDDRIDEFCHGLQGLGHPAFVRIGFEFNGLSWNGYLPGTYVQAFIRITQALRAHNLEAATVWCAAIPLNCAPFTYMDYYPGADYVDWWGIDPFDAGDFTSADMNAFMAAANNAGKPVMIGETTPRYVGVTDGQADWNAWFEPFFTFIQTKPGVKAFGYINWNWADYPYWATWGDARLEANTQVLSNYIFKTTSPLYLHGAGEQPLRAALGAADGTPPGQPPGLTAAFNDYRVDLAWGAATDNTYVVRYEVFSGGTLIGSTTGLSYFDADLSSGTAPSYTVRAVDSGGNPGPASAPAVAAVPNPLQKITNREFDGGAAPWRADAWNGGAVTFDVDNTSKLSGANSARLQVTTGTGTAWHVQLRQFFTTNPNKTYRLRFSAVADAAASIDVMLQQSHSPYASILMQTVSLTTSPQNFDFTSSGASADDTLYVTFMLGQANGRTIWIDNVRVEEGN